MPFRTPLVVLVVEREPDVGVSAAEILQSVGFAVGVVTTLPWAQRVVAAREVKSVVLDYALIEECEGGCEKVDHETAAHPAIIVIGGMGREELDRLQQRHGDHFFACLPKPVVPRDLIEVVRLAVGLPIGRGVQAVPTGASNPASPR